MSSKLLMMKQLQYCTLKTVLY